MKFDVFFYEAFEEEELEIKKHCPSSIKAGYTWKTIQESGHKQLPSAIISTRTQSIYPDFWGEKLSAIISRSTGYDHLLKYRNRTQTKAVMGYLPKYCHHAVAEQVLLYIFALLKKFKKQTSQFEQFNRDGLTGSELLGKKVLVVGVGNIGYEVVKLCKALGMQVKGVDIDKKFEDVEYVDIDQGMKWADIVSCNMNLTRDNIRYFNADLFSKNNPGQIFINTARGEMSSSLDLLNALKNNRLSAVALDVFDQESELAVCLREQKAITNPETRATMELFKLENVILTPHNSFNSREGVIRKAQQTVEQLLYYFDNKVFKWQV